MSNIPFDWYLYEPHQLQRQNHQDQIQQSEQEDVVYEAPDVVLTGQELLEGIETGHWRKGGMICFDQSVIPAFLDALFRKK